MELDIDKLAGIIRSIEESAEYVDIRAGYSSTNSILLKDCKLQEVASYLDVSEDDLERLRMDLKDVPPDDSNPFFIRDHDKCVLCGICVRVCEYVGAEAIDFAYRGHDTKIAAFLDRDIMDSPCVSCGECVEACPVGALSPRTEKPSSEVKTVCPYCGAGCEIHLGVRGGRVVSARGVRESPVNRGNLCVKGRFGLKFVNSPERLKKPLMKVDGRFVEFEAYILAALLISSSGTPVISWTSSRSSLNSSSLNSSNPSVLDPMKSVSWSSSSIMNLDMAIIR